MQAVRALLRAAIAIQLDGQKAGLKAHPDPFGKGPFAYTAFAGGFELRSKLMGRDDRPISLDVGSRKTE